MAAAGPYNVRGAPRCLRGGGPAGSSDATHHDHVRIGLRYLTRVTRTDVPAGVPTAGPAPPSHRWRPGFAGCAGRTGVGTLEGDTHREAT
ncbi:hypothetical protein GCM10010521_00870 [Streptomyces rameus]|uniref:Uncharacterized protein n=1 Tax=Streptomyces rameus TaxID=68261 RepID=A0ABP6MJS1_9ACTN